MHTTLNELINNNPGFLYLYIALFSLAIGSLLNVIIHRLPQILGAEWEQHCVSLFPQIVPANKASINLFFPLSFCPQCKAPIKIWQNIPILSYLFLRGRCHYCHKPIAIRYLLVESLSLLLSLFATWQVGFTPKLVIILVAIWILICLTFIDLEHQLLPDSLTLGLLWLGLLANTQALFTSLPNAVYSAAGAYLSLWIFIKLFYLLTGKIGMGNGDFKLFAAFGALLGWSALPFLLLAASLSGSVVGVIYLYVQKKPKETAIPFGPFLCVAGLISLFWGPIYLL